MHDFHVLAESRKTLLESLERRFRISVISYKNISAEHFSDDSKVYIPFIASGGCEEIFQSFGFTLPLPLFFLFDEQHNSLPAALELATYFSQGKLNTPLIYSERELSEELVEQLHRMQLTVRKLRKTRVALFGDTSPWLLSSGIDSDAVTRMLGVRFQEIEIESLAESFKHLTNLSRENQQLCRTILKNSKELKNCSNQDVYNAVRMYQVMDEMMVYHSCNALAVKCFDLIDNCRTTACLALSLFNRAGIPAACEGDVPSLLTMMIASGLTQTPVFMANPVNYDRSQNTIEMAHCTIPLSMIERYSLNTHFESGISVAVQGDIAPGEYFTAVKWLGGKLQRFFVSEGISLEADHYDNRCRTQLKLRLTEPVDSFLDKAIANHLLLVKGRHSRIFRYWNEYLIYKLSIYYL
jgi:L-fucose isomerase-like protein